MTGFEWDRDNILHIARHQVVPSEVEELFGRPHIVKPTKEKEGEKRFRAFGSTDGRRYLVVVFTYRPGGMIRTVTAYPMNRSTRNKYASQIQS
jgi:uncharacterized protein